MATNDGQTEPTWLSAEAAAQVLRMSARQVHRYGQSGDIHTRKAGRRILYLASDVAKLADKLHVDDRPLPVPREPDQQLLEYLQRFNAEYGETQRQAVQHIEQRIDDSEARIEQRMTALERRIL